MFCDSTDMSREHVIAQWISEILPGYGMVRTTDPRGKVYRSKKINTVVRRVCQECNGGWMNVIDDKVKPFFTPILMNKRTTLSPRAQWDLAVWVTKVCLMFELTHDEEPVFPLSTYKRFYRKKQPVPQTVMWMGGYFGEISRSGYQRQLTEVQFEEAGLSRARQVGWTLALQVHHAVFQFAGFFDSNRAIVSESEFRHQHATIHLLPPCGIAQQWPPDGVVFTDDTLHFFREAYDLRHDLRFE